MFGEAKVPHPATGPSQTIVSHEPGKQVKMATLETLISLFEASRGGGLQVAA
jgi:hypothetical protein